MQEAFFHMIDFNNAELIKLTPVDETVAKEVKDIFTSDEIIVGCYQAIRDYVVFTNKRLITINVQGITGKKKDFTSLPYTRIQAFSIETAGVLDLDSELELWFAGMGKITLEFSGKSNIKAIGKYISDMVL